MRRFPLILAVGLSCCFTSTAAAQFAVFQNLLPTSLQQCFNDGDCDSLQPLLFSNDPNGQQPLLFPNALIGPTPALSAFSYFDNVDSVERYLLRYSIGGQSNTTFDENGVVSVSNVAGEVVWLAADAEYNAAPGSQHRLLVTSEPSGLIFGDSAQNLTGTNGFDPTSTLVFDFTTAALLQGSGTYSIGIDNVGNPVEDTSDGVTLQNPIICLALDCFNSQELDLVALSYNQVGSTLQASLPSVYQENSELLLESASGFNDPSLGLTATTQLLVSTLPPSPIPEPGSGTILASLFLIFASRRRRQR